MARKSTAGDRPHADLPWVIWHALEPDTPRHSPSDINMKLYLLLLPLLRSLQLLLAVCCWGTSTAVLQMISCLQIDNPQKHI
jgi:hypothetical protein